MKTITVCYLPPSRVPGAATFVRNLQKFPPAGELIAFSDEPWDWPGLVKLKAPVEQLKNATFMEGPHANKPNPFVIHNCLFLCACKMARERQADYMLYIESDCRVGAKDWDTTVFDDYFALGRPTIAAGTLSVYNLSSAGREAALRGRELLRMAPRHGVPVGCYGWTWDRGAFGAKDAAPTTVFPNGAPAVYDVAWMESLWGFMAPGATISQARQNGPFDMAIGQHLWGKFGPDTYDVVGYLQSVYGGYGDALTTEDERRQMLLDGRVVVAHQFKGDWAP